MLFTEKLGKYTIWNEKTVYIMTQGRDKREVFRGSLIECHNYAEMHPYGTPNPIYRKDV